MHIGEFVRDKGLFRVTPYVPTDEVTTRMYPLLLTTGRILSQDNVGAQTRRTESLRWRDEDVLEIHPHDAEQRGIAEGDWVALKSRAGETVLRATLSERTQRGVVYRAFHHLLSGRERRDDGQLGLGDELPRVQSDRCAGAQSHVDVRLAEGVCEIHRRPARASAPGSRAAHGQLTAIHVRRKAGVDDEPNRREPRLRPGQREGSSGGRGSFAAFLEFIDEGRRHRGTR